MSRNIVWTSAKGLRIVLATLLIGTAIGAGSVAWSSSDTAPLSLPPLEHQAGFADLVAKVQPAVVQILSTKDAVNVDMSNIPQDGMPNFPQGSPFGDMFRQFFDRNGQMFERQNRQPTRGLGSGFIVDPAGYIVTNNHVIDGARDIKVTLNDGKEHTAKVVGRDAKTDLALLKIDAGGQLPYVAFGDSGKERVGDWVIAVGNPYGLGGTVTAGIVSAHDRDIDSGAYDDFLQIDAPINPGNSGGPLFDQSGHVIGIDTSIYSPSGGSVGIGFAIPSNLAKNIVAQLRDRGTVERGWLGVQMQPLTPALAKAVGLPNDRGVLVNEVQPNSPATRAKLRQGDVITSFNGTEIKMPRDLAVGVANMPAGKSAPITVWRDERVLTLDVTIGTLPGEKVASAETGTQTGGVPAPLGMRLKSLTDDDRDKLGLEPSFNGVVVGEVDPDGRAWESGVRSGDVIMRIGQHEVTTPGQAVNDIRTAQRGGKEQIPLVVNRDGEPYYLGLQLAG
jgi:serine protease Do